MTTNVFNPWSRPTQGWKIQCEEEGKTRAAAYDKTLLTIELTGHEKHIYRSGLAIVIMLPIIFCISCGVSYFIFKNPEGEFLWVWLLIFNMACNHIIWIIAGSIIMSSVSEVQDGAKKTQALAFEFETINECGDTENYVD